VRDFRVDVTVPICDMVCRSTVGAGATFSQPSTRRIEHGTARLMDDLRSVSRMVFFGNLLFPPLQAAANGYNCGRLHPPILALPC